MGKEHHHQAEVHLQAQALPLNSYVHRPPAGWAPQARVGEVEELLVLSHLAVPAEVLVALLANRRVVAVVVGVVRFWTASQDGCSLEEVVARVVSLCLSEPLALHLGLEVQAVQVQRPKILWVARATHHGFFPKGLVVEHLGRSWQCP